MKQETERKWALYRKHPTKHGECLIEILKVGDQTDLKKNKTKELFLISGNPKCLENLQKAGVLTEFSFLKKLNA